MEALNRSLAKAIDGGYLSYTASNAALKISHLLLFLISKNDIYSGRLLYAWKAQSTPRFTRKGKRERNKKDQAANSHLLFEDDTLIFCDADPNQRRFFQFIFLCFEAVSGLKVNLHKSELVLVGQIPHICANWHSWLQSVISADEIFGTSNQGSLEGTSYLWWRFKENEKKATRMEKSFTYPSGEVHSD